MRIVCAILALVVGLAAPAAAQSPANVADAYRQANENRILGDFVELLRIPNYAGDAENIGRNADHIEAMFAERGFAVRQLSENGSPPLIYGRRDTPGATRTIAIYVHYDGQQAHAENWLSPPYEPVLLDGAPGEGEALPESALSGPLDPEWRLQARSAGDDKAPLIALATALDALGQADIGLTSNIVLIFDGEEEVGSPNLDAILAANSDLFGDVDLWLFCDGPQLAPGRPTLVFGVRGFTAMEVTIFGPRVDLHSGHYGNWAPVPGTLLANLLASMKASDGTILVEGYERHAPSEAEAAAIAALPDREAELRRDFGLAWTEGDEASAYERVLFSSLTVRGLESGEVGDAVRNAIPSVATANIESRLAPGDGPDEMLDLLEAHIAGQGFHIVREPPSEAMRLSTYPIAMVTRSSGYPGVRTPLDVPVARQLAETLSAFGEPALVPTYGGSLPLYVFGEIADAPIIILPIANQDNNQHGPNENLRLGNLWYGIEAMAAILTMD